mmetsp:Transcript_9721/g.19822  ORF Transcript_9721/g.19822 Transcript_9721/m.19822 type:complete len:81 (+) Transcript_9721:1175-1417(+)
MMSIEGSIKMTLSSALANRERIFLSWNLIGCFGPKNLDQLKYPESTKTKTIAKVSRSSRWVAISIQFLHPRVHRADFCTT